MKVLSAVAILAVLPKSFGLQQSYLFDSRYGHVNPSCDEAPTMEVTLNELIMMQQEKGNSDPVAVECGYHATARQGTYDLPNGLIVSGELTFEDNPGTSTETVLEAPFILVRGHLEAGTLEKPFESKLRFVLTEFLNYPHEHHNLTVESLSENKLFSGSINFGDKAFVVYGGTISLVGPPEEKMIAKLAKTVQAGGTRKITVKGDWTESSWKPGDHFAITSTRTVKQHGDPGAKEFVLSSMRKIKKGKQTRLTLTEDFTMPLPGDFSKKKVQSRNYKGKKRNLLLTAEVFKITRNIVIQGISDGSQMADFIGTDYRDLQKDPRGGHFVIAHTPLPQTIQSVEFAAMGQPGILGRYPIHFHSCGNIDANTILRYNSIHHSKQRCVVVHATNGLVVKENAAFWANDHCFMVEDGFEHGNVFDGNIAANVKGSAFWFANPDNDVINNIAASSINGYEFTDMAALTETLALTEFSRKHNIPCQNLGLDPTDNSPYPNIDGCTWQRFIPLKNFDGNTVHNVDNGLFVYPPRGSRVARTPDVYKNLFVWNTRFAFDSTIDNSVLTNFIIYGAKYGIAPNSGNNVVIEKSVFQHVCEPVILPAGRHFNRQHSGVRIKNCVINKIWEDTESCAPIVIDTRNPHPATHSYMQSSSQIENLKLYKVKKLFAIADNNHPGIGLRYNHYQFGFFVYNVKSYNSSLKDIAPAKENGNKPSYIIRHGYSGDQLEVEGEDFFVKDCEKSEVGGYPFDDEFFLCQGQCWRPIGITLKKSLTDDPVSVQFVTSSGEVFLLGETLPADTRVCEYNHSLLHIFQIIPSGSYTITLVDSEMKEVSDDIYNEANVKFYHTDQEYRTFDYPLGCTDNVILEMRGASVPVSDFVDDCGGYHS